MTEKSCNICDNYSEVTERVQRACEKVGRNPDTVRIMAVTKTIDSARIAQAITCGIDLIGENKVQELLQKKDELSETFKPEIHFIGGLQSNKVKHIVGLVDLIQSVDSAKLASEIDRLSKLRGVTTDILIQVNIAGESTKNGIAPDKLEELIESVSSLENIRLRGLMAIPPFGDSVKYFPKMQQLFEDLKNLKPSESLGERFGERFNMLSMGMSGDYEKAIEYGSTLVRLGTALFGNRI